MTALLIDGHAEATASLGESWEAARALTPLPHYAERLDALQWAVSQRPNQHLSLVATDTADTEPAFLPVITDQWKFAWRLRSPGKPVTLGRFDLSRASVPAETVIGLQTMRPAVQLVGQMLHEWPHVDVVQLPRVRVGSPLEAALRKVTVAHDRRWCWAGAKPEPRFQINLGDDFDAYLHRQLDRQERSCLRRDRKRLFGDRGCTIQRFDQPGEVAAFLAQAAQVWDRSWHRASGASPLDTGPHLTSHLEWAASHGLLRGYIVSSDEGPIAMLIARLADGIFWLEKMSFDQAWRSYAPGKTVFVHALREAHDDGARWVDFGYGIYPYKKVWANAEVSTRPFTLVALRARPLVACLPPAGWRRTRAAAVDLIERVGLDEQARRFSSRRLSR